MATKSLARQMAELVLPRVKYEDFKRTLAEGKYNTPMLVDALLPTYEQVIKDQEALWMEVKDDQLSMWIAFAQRPGFSALADKIQIATHMLATTVVETLARAHPDA